MIQEQHGIDGVHGRVSKETPGFGELESFRGDRSHFYRIFSPACIHGLILAAVSKEVSALTHYKIFEPGSSLAAALIEICMIRTTTL